jgi:hypothetical protein
VSIIIRFVHDDRAGATGRPPLWRRLLAWAIANLILFDENDPHGYSHVEAVTPDGKFLGAHTTGVEARPMDYDAGFNRELLILLEADDEMSAKFYHYLNAVAAKHEGYNLMAILGFVTHFDLTTGHTTICSALITLALRWCSYFPNPFDVPAHRISVRDSKLMILSRKIFIVTRTDPRFLAHIGGHATTVV